jgi:hypothetical protein
VTLKHQVLRPRQCIICNTEFIPQLISKGRLTSRKTCSFHCHRLHNARTRAPWTRDDLELLQSLAESLPIKTLCSIFNAKAKQNQRPERSLAAIKARLSTLGYSYEPQHSVYTISSLARLLNCSKDAVSYWRKLGLKTTKSVKNSKGKVYIRIEDVRQLARKRPELFGGFQREALFIIFENMDVVEKILKAYPNRNRGIANKQPVRCIETGVVYDSHLEAARAFFVTRSGIYKAVTTGCCANNHHFEKVNP